MPYKPGKWYAICDVCGFKYYGDELRPRWDGLTVCSKDWEPRHPMDLLRTHSDESPTGSSPEADPTYVDVTYSYTPDPPPDGTFSGELP